LSSCSRRRPIACEMRSVPHRPVVYRQGVHLGVRAY
jgi:hypothetical protein